MEATDVGGGEVRIRRAVTRTPVESDAVAILRGFAPMLAALPDGTEARKLNISFERNRGERRRDSRRIFLTLMGSEQP